MKKKLSMMLLLSLVLLLAGQIGYAADRIVVSTEKAPKAIGPYSQAIRYGDMLFVSGMIPIDPKTNELSKGDIEVQATLVLDNIKAVVEAAGFSMKNVLKAEVFMKDLKDFGKYLRGKSVAKLLHRARKESLKRITANADDLEMPARTPPLKRTGTRTRIPAGSCTT